MIQKSFVRNAGVFMMALMTAGTIAAVTPMFAVTANAAATASDAETATASDAETATDSNAEINDGEVVNDYTGWVEDDGQYSYYENGVMITGEGQPDGVVLWEIDDCLFAFDDGGYALLEKLYTNPYGDKYYFAGADNTKLKGKHPGAALQRQWVKRSGDWYFFTKNYTAAKGYAILNYKGEPYKYEFDEDTSVLKMGWFEKNGNTYYADPAPSDMQVQGSLVSGWKNIDGYKCHFQEGDIRSKDYGKLLSKEKITSPSSSGNEDNNPGQGYMDNLTHTGSPSVENTNSVWKNDGKGWTYTAADGTQAKDAWVYDKGHWYSVGADGYMVTGLFTDPKDGHTYYLDPATGAMVTGYVTVNGVQYYFNPQPSDRTYSQDANGLWYWNGSLALPLGALVK